MNYENLSTVLIKFDVVCKYGFLKYSARTLVAGETVYFVIIKDLSLIGHSFTVSFSLFSA